MEEKAVLTIDNFLNDPVDFVFKRELNEAYPSDVRDEIKEGDIELYLMVGTKQVLLPPSKIKPIKCCEKEEWESKPFGDIILKDDIRVK